MKKVLITGAAGFIGFHLAKHLKKLGHFVIGLDNFNNYYLPTLKEDRKHKLIQQDIPIVLGDIQDSSLISDLIEKNEITHVVHLAAQAGVRHSFTHPHDYIDSNITGFVCLLEALKNKPKTKLVFASSSSVYGLTQEIPFKENTCTDTPTNLYGATKKAGEALAFSYHHLYQIPMIGLRFFTVYGPWGRPDMAYFQFTKNILEGKPIKVFNHGDMKRDFTYIDDIIEGTTNALDLCSGYDIFNLGNKKPVSVLTMIEILENLLEKKAEKQMLPFQSGEMQKTFASIAKSNSLLNFFPKTSLEEGLKQFVYWYKEYFSCISIPQ